MTLNNNHWDSKREQILSNGTGIYVQEYVNPPNNLQPEFVVVRTERSYKDYKKHGKHLETRNGKFTFYQEWKNGALHGISRNYYNNGNVVVETVYEHGRQVSRKSFPEIQNSK